MVIRLAIAAILPLIWRDLFIRLFRTQLRVGLVYSIQCLVLLISLTTDHQTTDRLISDRQITDLQTMDKKELEQTVEELELKTEQTERTEQTDLTIDKMGVRTGG